MDLTLEDAKRAARILRDQLPGTDRTHAQALEIVARQLGFRDWDTASAGLLRRRGMSAPVPVLRSLYETRARAAGRVWTAVGVPLPFVISELDPGRTWGWRVAGVPATRRGARHAPGCPPRATVSSPTARAAVPG